MKNLILSLILIIAAALSIPAQEKTVVVTQSFLDDATRAFNLVVEQRDALAKYAAERLTADAERRNAQMLIQALDELIAIKDKTLSAKDDLIKIHSQAIEIQSKIIEKLEKQLNRPQSSFAKFTKVLKEVLILTSGIFIGRGLGF